jgi:hypothetical protein
MTEMNTGSLEPETSKKDDKGPGKSGFRWAIFVVALVVLVVIAIQLIKKHNSVPNDPKPDDKTASLTSTSEQTAEQQLRRSFPETEANTLPMRTDQVVTIDVDAGMSVRFVPTGPVALAYEHYIDGKLVCEFFADGSCKGDPVANAPIDPATGKTKAHKEGWRLKEGQSVTRNDLAYVTYMGPEPELKTWYPLAIAAGAHR